MSLGQDLYARSDGFEKSWEELSPELRSLWDTWGSRTQNSPIEALSGASHPIQAILKVAYSFGLSLKLGLDIQALPEDFGIDVGWLNPPVIDLDSQFHRWHKPDITDTHFYFDANFDTIYRLKIPYEAIKFCLVKHEEPPPLKVG